MSYRFTNTDKWQDSWFSQLQQIEMLLFIYLCDNCDIAGFIELNYKRWANDLNSSISTIEGALKGLQRGLLLSKDVDCIFIKNFLKHQKNYPLNEKNKAHVGILRRFELYSQKFNIQDINKFIEGGSEGLPSPTGKGKGKGKGNDTGSKCLFKNSIYFENLQLIEEKIGEKYNKYNLGFYYESVLNWSDSKNAMAIDWLATIRNFILGDIKKNTVRLKS